MSQNPASALAARLPAPIALLSALLLMFAVAFDQGQVAQLVSSLEATTVHEVFHDARHMLGFPCH